MIVDSDVEFTRRMTMVSAGMLRPEVVVAWYFGVSEEEAKSMMPEGGEDELIPEGEE